MTSDSAEQLQRLFLAALEYSPEHRADFLDDACRNEPALRKEVESLLEADARAEEKAFLQHPTAKIEHQVASIATRMEGRDIGPYRILKSLGQGGMGRVYLAERKDVGQQVALKLVRNSFASPDIRRRFLLERRVLARLNHPNIARLLDAGVTDDDMPYFVMEVVEGEPITIYSDRGHLDIEARLKLFEAVCEAVRYAHQRLVVHRDLKPPNILVGETDEGAPQVKLLDFGIAKMLVEEDEDPLLTRTGMRVMTTQYAAPEQVLGDTITTATDVYALGLLLYQLLTGQHPYEVQGQPHEASRVILETVLKKPSTAVRQAGSTRERSEAITINRSTTIEQLQRRLRGDLDVICLKALEKEPERRYQSAEELRADIRRYMAGLPVEARAPTISYRARKFIVRHRVGVTAALLVALAVISGLGTALWQAQRARAAAEVARAEAATSEQVKDYLIEVFGASNPWEEPMGAEMTARELLERGVERVEALNEEPVVQAELMDALGNVYSSIGLFDEARSLLEQSLATRKAVLGEENVDVARSLASLAGLLFDAGYYEEAEPLYRESLAMRRALLDAEHIDLAASLNDLAALLNSMGRQEESEPLLRESLAIQRAIYGEEHPTIAISMANLAGILRSREAYDEAEALYREVLTIQRRLLGEEHPNVATSLNSLSRVVLAKGNITEAESLLRESLAMRERIFGEEHDLTAGARHQLGRLLMDAERPAEAEPLFRQALSGSKKVNGEQHWKTAVAKVGLSRALIAQEHFEEAQSLLEEAYAFYQSGAPAGPPQRAESARQALVELYTAWGKPDRATAYQPAISR